MDAAGISKTLDSIMSSPGIIGSMIIDSSTGLCLGARGKATEDDATYLTIASRKALNDTSVGAVTHKDCKVLLRRGNNGIIVAIYKDVNASNDVSGSL